MNLLDTLAVFLLDNAFSYLLNPDHLDFHARTASYNKDLKKGQSMFISIGMNQCCVIGNNLSLFNGVRTIQNQLQTIHLCAWIIQIGIYVWI